MKLSNILILGFSSVVVLSSQAFSIDLPSKAKEKISEQLSDPKSADFRNLQIVINSVGEEAVCGEVNAKNRFGGYVGFQPFSYSNKLAIIVDEENGESIDKYNLAGCAGPEKELEIRLKAEAYFNCNVIWNMMKNVIVSNETEEKAIDSAIEAVKQRAKENSAVIVPEQENAIRLEFSKQLSETLKNKKQTKAIKQSPEYQEAFFIPSCTTHTLGLLKVQMGLE